MANYCTLNWENFIDHTKLLLHNLYDANSYADVTLICDDQAQLQAHKLVLGACSSVFENIFQNNIDLNFIYLRGIRKFEIEPILQFIYTGQLIISEESMIKFFKVTKDLGLKINNANDTTKTSVVKINKREENSGIIKEDMNYDYLNINLDQKQNDGKEIQNGTIRS